MYQSDAGRSRRRPAEARRARAAESWWERVSMRRRSSRACATASASSSPNSTQSRSSASSTARSRSRVLSSSPRSASSRSLPSLAALSSSSFCRLSSATSSAAMGWVSSEKGRRPWSSTVQVSLGEQYELLLSAGVV
ncbi:unnamed protein product, partial [Musa acuminata subsp. burmannicoides]